MDASTSSEPLLVERVERRRVLATSMLDRDVRSELGQFLTPKPLASFMASLFDGLGGRVRVLDAGAGVGSLLAALSAEACRRDVRPTSIEATAFEVDARLAAHLRSTLSECRNECAKSGVRFAGEVLATDFIASAVDAMTTGERPAFTHAILNPPYKKLHTRSSARRTLRRVGIETSNLYTAFLALAIALLKPGGELVAITPRSFCNGPYFRSFRELFLREMSLRRIHLFDSRTAAFSGDAVLQENVVFHAVKGSRAKRVVLSTSRGPQDERFERTVPMHEVVHPSDPERFIRLVPDDRGRRIAERFARLPARLEDLRIAVSTGKVVDFRAHAHLRRDPVKGTGPLVYPSHFESGFVRWPKAGKKPNALVDARATSALWMPSGHYVLVKRFSSKEEPRRIVAAIFDPKRVPGEKIGFENHLDVFHRDGHGLPKLVAYGLAAFLGTTLVDAHFRQFNGHTQVNATDLRSLRYPSIEQLALLGQRVQTPLPQRDLDRLVEEVLGS